jgi:hypothetical protein
VHESSINILGPELSKLISGQSGTLTWQHSTMLANAIVTASSKSTEGPLHVDDKVLSGSDALTRAASDTDDSRGFFDFSWTDTPANKEQVRMLLQRVLSICGKDVVLPPNPVVFIEEHEVVSKPGSGVPSTIDEAPPPLKLSLVPQDSEVNASLAEFDFLDGELGIPSHGRASNPSVQPESRSDLSNQSETPFSVTFDFSQPRLTEPEETLPRTPRTSVMLAGDPGSLRSTSHISISSIDSNPPESTLSVSEDAHMLSAFSTAYFFIAQDAAEDFWEQLMADMDDSTSSLALSRVFHAFSKLVSV